VQAFPIFEDFPNYCNRVAKAGQSPYCFLLSRRHPEQFKRCLQAGIGRSAWSARHKFTTTHWLHFYKAGRRQALLLYRFTIQYPEKIRAPNADFQKMKPLPF
jgi:hypothetical protein